MDEPVKRLLDANVLIALLDPEHVAHGTATGATETGSWVDRIAILAALRVLSRKEDSRAVLARLDQAIQAGRVTFVAEPPAVDGSLRAVIDALPPGEPFNTDAYLVALATALDATFVTFDRAIARRFPEAPVLTLGDVE